MNDVSPAPRALTIFCGSRLGRRESYRAAATTVGERAAEAGITIVYGGGKVGLMGMLADAALGNGGRVIGVIPRYLCAREVLHPDLTETHVVDDLFERKRMMLELGDAFVTLPGGFGTLDEYFEVASWIQLGQIDKPNIVINVDGFFDPLLAVLRHVVDGGFADTAHVARTRVVDSPAALFDLLAPAAAL